MNPTAQNNDPTTASGQVKSSVPTQTKTPTPVNPVGSTQKETGPASNAAAAVSEFVKPTEQAPRISPELQKAGVEHSPDTPVPKLTLEDRKAGLGLAKEHVPVITEPSGQVKLPMTQQQAKVAMHKKVSDSVRWLAMLVLRQLKKQNT